MSAKTFAIACALASIAVPGIAQTRSAADPAGPGTPLATDPGYDRDTARTRAINDSARPAVQAANDEAAAQARMNASATSVVNAAMTARHARDVARYRAAQRARRHVIAQDAAVAARQEQAYADAMADWRLQVAACKRGRTRACNAPTPNPANY